MMLFSILLAYGFTLTQASSLQPGKLKVWSPKPFGIRSPDVQSNYHLELSRLKLSKARRAKYCNAIRSNPHNAGLISLVQGQAFATNIKFGNDSFYVIVDTGSSDLWLAQKNFSCLSVPDESPVPQTDCKFGPLYNPSSAFKPIPNQNFNIQYGSGEHLIGTLGFEQVALAGVKVNQTVAKVYRAAWFGDGTTSGLLGLAYGNLTSGYRGNDPSADVLFDPDSQVPYDPTFTTMYKQGLVAPVFSLAISRSNSGPAGYLSLGGLPPVAFIPVFTSTPILITTAANFYPRTYDFYTIELDGCFLNGRTLKMSGGAAQYVIDSGTPVNYVPTFVADAVSAAFRPAGVYDPNTGNYNINCDAKAPAIVGITINKKTFFINPLDMIVPTTNDDGSVTCTSGFADGGPDPDESLYTLGDVFLKNVVAVFDVGKVEMRFAAREFYRSKMYRKSVNL